MSEGGFEMESQPSSAHNMHQQKGEETDCVDRCNRQKGCDWSMGRHASRYYGCCRINDQT